MYDINRKLHYVFYTQSALDFVVKMYSFAVKKLNEKIVFYIFHSFSYIEYSRVDYSHLSNSSILDNLDFDKTEDFNAKTTNNYNICRIFVV